MLFFFLLYLLPVWENRDIAGSLLENILWWGGFPLDIVYV